MGALWRQRKTGSEVLSLLLVLVAFLWVSDPAARAEDPSQTIVDEPGALHTVGLFQVLCYDVIPDIESIAAIASEAGFQALEGEALEAFQPTVRAEELLAWRFEDLGQEFVLSASRSAPDDAVRRELPAAFQDAKSYACSLSNPSPAPDVVDVMTEVTGRPPDEVWDQAPLRVHNWYGESENLLVQVYFYGALNQGVGGLLSVVAFLRE